MLLPGFTTDENFKAVGEEVVNRPTIFKRIELHGLCCYLQTDNVVFLFPLTFFSSHLLRRPGSSAHEARVLRGRL